MSKITYTDKVALNENASVNAINKVSASDMNEIKNVVNNNTPVGSISLYAGSTAPTGWLICDGSAVSRITYADLYSVIGTTYGSGDGSTTFNVPNLKGRVPVGQDTSQTEFDNLGEIGGSKALQQHNHAIVDNSNKYVMYYKGDGSGNINATIGGNSLLGGSNSEYTGNAGTGTSGNLQPYIVLNYIISY